MNRLIAIAVMAVLGSLVAACGLPGTSVLGHVVQDTTDSTDETQPQEHPAGFYLSGEFVKLTEFDPNDPSLEPIRACEEIPQEVFDEIGLGPITVEQKDSFGMTGCAGRLTHKLGESMGWNLVSGPTLLREISDDPKTFIHHSKPSALGSQTLQKDLEQGVSCTSSVDTERTLFSVSVNDYTGMTSDENCAVPQLTSSTRFTKLFGGWNELLAD
ncbi:hypothetical protein [Corynebacterium yudongzhengii]|uniref:hypothetical protein n=1 Tax=Corynebacterium yudongzhengii TaxID=2080740 RepID=UPI0011B25782|nr:hypothetical protein [Corynebacterium yudongzhengii]